MKYANENEKNPPKSLFSAKISRGKLSMPRSVPVLDLCNELSTP
jgi:hypothetical protein